MPWIHVTYCGLFFVEKNEEKRKKNTYSPVLLLIETCKVARGYEMSQKSFHSRRQIVRCNELADCPQALQYCHYHNFPWKP